LTRVFKERVMTISFDVLCDGYIAKKFVMADGADNPCIGEVQKRFFA
jgi:hypothetical protein